MNEIRMTKRSLLWFAALAAVFLVLNRAAYHGYFQDDDIASLAWTRWGSFSAYLKGALTPIFADSFRAVGFYYYHVAERVFGLDFPKYVAVLHIFHLLNVWVLWLLMRQLGAAPLAAGAACTFFALHMALFDAVWKPSFVFDLLCGTFCLISILLWARGRWILSFLSFWLAYKSKEPAVMLPLVLVCYELWFGSRRWMRLAPFLAGSLALGLQALVLTPVRDEAYVFHFTPDALGRTAPFYAERVFLAPYLGFLLPIGAVSAPNRRTWFGLAMMGLFFFPLLCLPGRVLNAYCYLPFTGLAVALAGMMETASPAAIAIFLLLWLPVDLHWLRTQRNDTLRQDQQAREWITTVGSFAKSRPEVTEFIYNQTPEEFHVWGIEGTVKYFYKSLDPTILPADSPEGMKLRQSGRAAVLEWDWYWHRLTIKPPE